MTSIRPVLRTRYCFCVGAIGGEVLPLELQRLERPDQRLEEAGDVVTGVHGLVLRRPCLTVADDLPLLEAIGAQFEDCGDVV